MEKNSLHDEEELLLSSALPHRTNKDVVGPLVSEYESFIEALQKQIEFHKVEHEHLKKDLSELIAENGHLSDKLKKMMGRKLSEEAVIYTTQKKESDMVANLQHQLSLVSQEKDAAIELWHLALREGESGDKYITSHDSIHADMSNRKMEDLRKDYTEAITLLESKLNSTKNMLAREKAERENVEKKYQRIAQENETLITSLKCRQEELEASLEGQCAVAKKLQEVEKKVAELEMQVAASKENEHDLESALSQCHEHIERLIQKNVDAQEKVSESLHLVECAMAEKEVSVISESKIRDENARLQQMMTSVVDEAGVRVKEEMDNMKQQYNSKLKTLLLDMKKLEIESNEKEKKLRKVIEERSILEGQLVQVQKQMPDAERRLSMVHEELTDVRRSNLQLAMEKESLQAQIERVHESHTADLRRLGQEYQAMEQRMLTLQAQLETVTSDRDVQINNLIHQIRLLEREKDKNSLISTIELKEWQQKQVHQQEYEDLLSQLQKVQKQSDATASELEHHLIKQHSLKTKYQKAMKTLTEKLEKRIRELHQESNALKKENKYLQTKLNNIQEKLATQTQNK
ncbi:hypothetical protein L9F63_017688 [Diploptera punctata]|uniref:Sodium channel and clathrin linker 1 n=1 Tax=Diploptera punctata TaxID=6984 RepID=A0AAD7ZYC2_DIPPU|nr:hypothetical protein L9F63_017688 [Diploptera punctata]